jgi:hypothetical protein
VPTVGGVDAPSAAPIGSSREVHVDLRFPGEVTHAELHTRHADLALTDARVTGRITNHLLDLFPIHRSFHAVRLDAVSHVAVVRAWQPLQVLVGLLLCLVSIGALGLSVLRSRSADPETLAAVLVLAIGAAVILTAKRRALVISDWSGRAIVARVRAGEAPRALAFVRAVGDRLAAR